MKKIRAVAFYLPQYHPISENNEWWGPGFTEWTNVAAARPLFRGHYQPHIPADLGFYDLRLEETRELQAEIAAEHGIEGFCYYHYWFAGRRLLQRPFDEVLASGRPDFPFCLCWANQTWTGVWHGAPDRILIEQSYPGQDDFRRHFLELLPAFKDPRYICVEGSPLFVIYRPTELPGLKGFLDLWRAMARAEGFPDLFVIGIKHDDGWDARANGFDAGIFQRLPPKNGRIPWSFPLAKFRQTFDGSKLTIYRYEEVVHELLPGRRGSVSDLPCVIPNWDNTPRSGRDGLVLHGSTPELFRIHVHEAISKLGGQRPEERFLFIKSWNEWAEGNHLEPDRSFGSAYLKVLSESLR